MNENYIQSFKDSLENDENFNIDSFMENLYTDRNTLLYKTRFWHGSGYINIDNLEGKMVHIWIKNSLKS